MTGKAVRGFLAAIFLLLLAVTTQAAAPARLEPPAVLRKLQDTRRKFMQADATVQVRQNFQNSKRLCLDLIFYSWVSQNAGWQPGVERLDEITDALSEPIIDSGVGWANSVLRGKGSKRGMLNLRDEQIKTLSELRDAIRLGINNRERSPMRASEVIDQGITQCGQLKLELTGAALLTVLGDQYLGMDQYQQAEDCYERARGVFRDYAARGNLAIVYEDLGTLYSNMRNYAVASESFKSAGNEWRELGRGDSAGRQFIQAGVALAASGRREPAYELIMEGLRQSREWALSHRSYSQLVKDLRDVGDFCLMQGDVLGARDMFADAARQAETAGDREGQVRALKELAEVLTQADDAAGAKDATTRRNALLDRIVRDGQSAVWKTTQKTGTHVGETERLLPVITLGAWAAGELGNKELAEQCYRQAAVLYHRLGNAREAVGSLEAVASICEARGDEEKALSTRLEAISLAESVDGKSTLAADEKSRVADSYAASGKTDMAVSVLGECEAIYRSTGAMRQLALTLQKRGDIFLQARAFDKAAKDFRETASIYIKDVGEPWTGAQAYWRLADALGAQGNDREIAEILSSAIAQVERWCVEQSIDPDLEPLGSQILSLLYTRLIPLQIKSDQKQQAWEMLRSSERYRWHANLLGSLRGEKNASIDAVVDEYERTASGGLSRPKKQGEVKQVAKDWAEMVNYLSLLRKWYPMQFRSMRVDPLAVAKQSARLPEGLVVVDYLFTDTASYAFVISRSSSSVWQLSTTRQQVEEMARRFEQIMRASQETVEANMPIPSGSWDMEELKPLREVISGMYTLLIEPIRSQFSGMKSVAFALPTELSGFPLHALGYLQGDGVPRFLIEDIAVGYVGPNSLMDLLEPGAIDPKKDKLAIFADPAGNLPGAVDEAQMIRSDYPNSESYVKEKASKESFMTAAKACSLLHIAAHHQLDPDQSQFTIALAPSSASDGVVRMSDLYELRNWGVSLVVLSMCESLGSTSPSSDGESIVSELFSVVGVPSVVGSHWKVSDKASSKLMNEFYKALAAPGSTRTQALQIAQKALISSDEFKHPYYWAGFSLYGNQN